MCKIWIFGGTTEGRLLAEYCSREKIEAWVSVASEYGEELLQEELMESGNAGNPDLNHNTCLAKKNLKTVQKDPNSQVGACIVSEDNKILSMGYNGFPKGCSDDEFPWAREGEPLDTKYLYVTHSELNAILNYRGGSLEGAKLYVSLFPCNECAKEIIQSGIKTIVYDCDKYENTPSVIASKRMLDAAGVRYYKYKRTGREINLTV